MLFLIIALVPAFILIWFFWLSSKNSNKPWLKPLFSHSDFLKELYSVVTVALLGVFWTNLYSEIIKNFQVKDSSWFLELWILIFVLLIFGVSYYVKSYFTLIGGAISAVIYAAVQLVKWSYESYFFILKDRLTEFEGQKIIAPAASLGIFWIFINLVYFVGKSMSGTKIFGRSGNIIRALVIFTNLVILAILSNSFFIDFGLKSSVAGNSIIHSWPLLISALLIIIVSGYGFVLNKKINLKSFEIGLSLIPGFVFLIYSFIPFIRISNDSSLENNFGKIIWAVIFNSLYLSYAIYLIYKSDKTQERWLKIYSIILIVGVVIERLVDIATNFNFSGIYLSIFGGIVMIAVSLIELSRKKSQKN